MKSFYFKPGMQLKRQVTQQPFRVSGELQRKWSRDFCDLLAQGYIKDANKRPNMFQYITHPVFKPFLNRYSSLFQTHFQKYIIQSEIKKKVTSNDGAIRRISLLIKLRKNVIKYFLVYDYFKSKKMNLFWQFAFLKRFLQWMSHIYLCAMEGRPPSMLGLKGFCSPQIWSSITKERIFDNLLLTLKEDIEFAADQYTATYAQLLKALDKNPKMSPPPFDLNKDVAQNVSLISNALLQRGGNLLSFELRNYL